MRVYWTIGLLGLVQGKSRPLAQARTRSGRFGYPVTGSSPSPGVVTGIDQRLLTQLEILQPNKLTSPRRQLRTATHHRPPHRRRQGHHPLTPVASSNNPNNYYNQSQNTRIHMHSHHFPLSRSPPSPAYSTGSSPRPVALHSVRFAGRSTSSTAASARFARPRMARDGC
jgi:hypothetical protein